MATPSCINVEQVILSTQTHKIGPLLQGYVGVAALPPTSFATGWLKQFVLGQVEAEWIGAMAPEHDFDPDIPIFRLMSLFWSRFVPQLGLKHESDFLVDLISDFSSDFNSNLDS